MMERDSIRFGDTTIEYQVRRSDRRKKTVQVTVDGGGVQVAAPMDTPADDLQTLVRRRAPWILNHASGRIVDRRAEAVRQRGNPALPGTQRAHGVRARRCAYAESCFRPLAVQHQATAGPPRYSNGTNASARLLLRGIESRAAMRLQAQASRSGCPVSAAAMCPTCSFATSGSAGVVARPTAPCDSTGV